MASSRVSRWITTVAITPSSTTAASDASANFTTDRVGLTRSSLPCSERGRGRPLLLGAVNGGDDLLRIFDAGELEVGIAGAGRVEVHGSDLQHPLEHRLVRVHVLHALDVG